jgi:hypothetical protein
MVVLVLAAGALAIPASSVVAPVIVFIIGVSMGPLLLIGAIVGFNRRTVRLLAFAVIGVMVLVAVLNLVGGPLPAIDIGIRTPAEAEPSPPDQALAIGGGILLLLAAIAVALVVGWGLVQLIALPFGGIGTAVSFFWSFVLLLVVLVTLIVLGRRRQRRARDRAAEARAAQFKR